MYTTRESVRMLTTSSDMTRLETFLNEPNNDERLKDKRKDLARRESPFKQHYVRGYENESRLDRRLCAYRPRTREEICSRPEFSTTTDTICRFPDLTIEVL